MAVSCLMPIQAEALKKAFKNGDISFQQLYNAKSSVERVSMVKKYAGETAKEVVARLEKTFLSPNQKLAARNWVFREIAQAKPLYKGVSLDQASQMASTKVNDLKSMSSADRVAFFNRYVVTKTASELNARFETAKKKGDLANWEERTMGTKTVRENKKVRQALAQLDALNDMGVLNPEQMQDFMQSFVETKLGVPMSMAQSQKLSELITAAKNSFDTVYDSGDWTHTNRDAVTELFMSEKALRDYADSLQPVTFQETANLLVGTARATLLGSPRIARNSLFYQIIPTLERALVKRLVSGAAGEVDINASFVEKVSAKLSGITPSKESAKFIASQIAMATKIYHRTGFDISRMDTIDGGYSFFGGEKFRPVGSRKMADAVGIKEKVNAGINAYARFINLGPKWFAGGTDMLAANFHRADTALMLSAELAKLEAQAGKLPQGVTEAQRADQLLKESYSFSPKDPKAVKIREAAIKDAHDANGTSPDKAADWVIKIRDSMTLGGIKFGSVVVPFAKIATTILSRGLQTASGVGIGKSLYKIQQATKLPDGTQRASQIYNATIDLVGYVGLTAAAGLFAGLLEEDEYIGGYDALTTKEYGLSRARGAGAGYVKIAGKWIPLRYFPIINIPVSAIMTSRQALSQGRNPIEGYLVGMLGAVLEAPLISTVASSLKKSYNAVRSKQILKAMGLDGERMWNWARVRAVPSVLSYDLYNKMFPPETKYDFMGREIERGLFRDDTSNEITIEYHRLNNVGFMPTIADPQKDISAEELNKLKRDYTDAVYKLINSWRYGRMSDENKMKSINKLRQAYITRKIK